MTNMANSLAHTKWVCKYYIVFTPKYRRKIIYNQYKESIRNIIKQLCAYKGVKIIEGHWMSDYNQMLVSIPSKLSVLSFMGYLIRWRKTVSFCMHGNSIFMLVNEIRGIWG